MTRVAVRVDLSDTGPAAGDGHVLVETQFGRLVVERNMFSSREEPDDGRASIRGEQVSVEAVADASAASTGRRLPIALVGRGKRTLTLRWEPGPRFTNDMRAQVDVAAVAALATSARIDAPATQCEDEPAATARISCVLLGVRTDVESAVGSPRAAPDGESGPDGTRASTKQLRRNRKVTARYSELLSGSRPLTKPITATTVAEVNARACPGLVARCQASIVTSWTFAVRVERTSSRA